MKLWGVAARGQSGEDVACRFLERQGYRILDRNVRFRTGELDVVAEKDGTVVFVEVRQRADASRGDAVDSVTPSKRRRVVEAARMYAASRGLSERSLRFDVVAIDGPAAAQRVRHFEGAFDAAGE